MIDTIAIWTHYDPDIGEPDSSEGCEWRDCQYGRFESRKSDVRYTVDQPNGILRAEFEVPKLLGVDANEVWKCFKRIPEALRADFSKRWHGYYPPFEEWLVSRLDAVYDYRLPRHTDIQEILSKLGETNVPDFVLVVYGNPGSRTVTWQTKGHKGRIADSPDIIRVYDKAKELEDIDAPASVVSQHRGVLRFEYQVRDSHGALQRISNRDFGDNVRLHEVVSPIRIHQLLKRGAKLLGISGPIGAKTDPLAALYEKLPPERARSRYQHYLWIRSKGESAWARELGASTKSDVIRDLKSAGLWPVNTPAFEVDLQLPFTPSLAGRHWIYKLKARYSR